MFKNQILSAFILLGLLTFSSCKKEETKTNETTTTPANYIKVNGTTYPLTGGNIVTGLYDGGPNYHAAIFLKNDAVTFLQDDDDPGTVYSGQGNGIFLNLILPSDINSLEGDNFALNSGWAGFNEFNFSNPDSTIYTSNPPANFIDLEQNLQNVHVKFTKSNNTYTVNYNVNNVQIHYSGALTE